MEGIGALSTTLFAYKKDRCICDTLLCVAHALQSEFERGQVAEIVQIDFGAAFVRVNHQEILVKLCHRVFLFSLSMSWMVADGCRS